MVYKSPKETELLEKLGPVVSSLNYELRDVDIRPGNPALVRITIDIKDRSRAVNLDDCYEVHKVVDPLFDVWDPLQVAYTLEVSSPGEKAPLRLKEHFDEAVGCPIEFKTRDALKIPFNPTAAPRKNWKGTLVSVSDDAIRLEDSMGVHEVKASQIEGARWMREWTAKEAELARKESAAKEKGESV